MFKKHVLPVLGAAFLAFASACGDDGVNKSFVLEAKVDGVQFRGSVVQAGVDTTFLTVSGADLNYIMTLHVTLPPVNTTGTKTLPAGDSTAVDFAELTNGSTTWATNYGGSGTVTFTRNDNNETSGTFTFNAGPIASTGAAGTKVVTSGTFKAKFQN